MKLSIIRGPTEPALLHLTLGELVRKQAKVNGSRTAVCSQQQDQSLTFTELEARTNRLAACLLQSGVRRGDRVAILLGNRMEYVEIFIASAKIGAVATLLNFAYTSAELHSALIYTTPTVLFTTVKSSRYDYRQTLDGIEKRVPSLHKIVLLEDVCTLHAPFEPNSISCKYDDLLNCDTHIAVDWAEIENTLSDLDVVSLLFTSGSTGAPKAAALTHYGMLNSAYLIGQNMNISSQDKVMVPVPLFHAFGLIIGLCTTLVTGAAIVLPSEYFDAHASLEAIERYKCTGLYGVTTMMIDLMGHPAFTTTRRSSLRSGLIAGSAMPEELLLRIMNKFPIRDIYTNWGQTELSSIATMTSASDPITKKLKTAGKLLPNLTAKIVKPNTGEVLPRGSRGEIVVSGWAVMQSYYNNPSVTGQAIRRHSQDHSPGQAGVEADGSDRRWMHTGDEGYFDKDGYVVVTGRIKDLIIRGGENIAPLEIEERLFQHPAITQASVFGIPSQRYGEEVAAFLELAEGCAKPTDEAIRAWVRQSLARFKAPVRIWWLGNAQTGCPSEWPKTANGKLRKIDIRAIGIRLLQAGSSGIEGERSRL